MDRNYIDYNDFFSDSGYSYYEDNNLEKLKEIIRESNRLKTDAKRTSFKSIVTTENNNRPKEIIEYPLRDENDFKSDTHIVQVLVSKTNEVGGKITTRIVGVERVDWWEYVLLYGFFKYVWIVMECMRHKDHIERPKITNATFKVDRLKIRFVPKKHRGVEGDVTVMYVDVPIKEERVTKEYQRGFFLYEENFSNIVNDYTKLIDNIETLIGDKIHTSLVWEIKEQLKNGKLSRF